MKFRVGDQVTHVYADGVGTITEIVDGAREEYNAHFPDDDHKDGQVIGELMKLYRPPVGTRVRDTELEDRGTIKAHKGKRKVVIEWDKDTYLDEETLRYPFAEWESLEILPDEEVPPLFVDRVETCGVKDGSQKFDPTSNIEASVVYAKQILKATAGEVFMDGQHIGSLSTEAVEENSDPDLALAVEEKIAQAWNQPVDLPETRTETFTFEIQDVGPDLLRVLGFEVNEPEPAYAKSDFERGLKEGKRIGYAKGRSDIHERDLDKIHYQKRELASLNRMLSESFGKEDELEEKWKTERDYRLHLEGIIRQHNISTGQLRDPNHWWTKTLRWMGVIK